MGSATGSATGLADGDGEGEGEGEGGPPQVVPFRVKRAGAGLLVVQRPLKPMVTVAPGVITRLCGSFTA